ncbi:hypothetical protein ACFQ46_22460 [Kineococcus sp. GCM10028916]|uniref:hypothetical protein n=1 Tax=Kineococcus sp. GCM10028916 TaxID=3273394 RepID=UPI0036441781
MDLEPRLFAAPTGSERYHLVDDDGERRRGCETCDVAFGLPTGTTGALLTPELLAGHVARPVLA